MRIQKDVEDHLNKTPVNPESMDNEWISVKVKLPANGVMVDTKIDDERGVRNVQELNRIDSLWFSGGMYVYYTPTHWKHKTP